MRPLARAALVLALAAGFAVPASAPAAPATDLYTSFQSGLTTYAGSEADSVKQAALQAAAALFDDASPSLAADIADAIKAFPKIEKAYGTNDATLGALLDANISYAYLAVFTRSNQAYVGAAQKELARRNVGAVKRLALTQNAKLRKALKAFPETPNPNKPISRVTKLKALLALEKYGAALGKRYKIELNAF